MRKELEFASDVLGELIMKYIHEDTTDKYWYGDPDSLLADEINDYLPLISKLFELFTETEKREFAKEMYSGRICPDAICEVFKTLGGIDTTDLMDEWKANPHYIEYMKLLNAANMRENTKDDK